MKPIFKKFNDLEVRDINFDFHIHTSQTDGASTPEEIVKKAIELKLTAIAFTEHVNKNSNWFDDFASRVGTLKANRKIKVFLGIETKALDFNGAVDATRGMIARADVVVGVVHRYLSATGGLIPLKEIKSLGRLKAAELEFNLAMGLLKNKDVDVLGHPFGVYSMFHHKLPINYMKRLLVESIKRGKAIEINTKYIVDKNLFFKLLKKINPYVSIGSDAHNKNELARSFNFIKLYIKRFANKV